jgi:hypothetical protein
MRWLQSKRIHAIVAKHLESARHHDSEAPAGLGTGQKRIPADVRHLDAYLEIIIGSR